MTEIPRRRHSERSMWSTPAVEPTMSCREGRRQRRLEEIGVGSTQRTARTDWAWRERKEWDGSVESSGSSKRKWLNSRSRKGKSKAGGRCTRTRGSSSSFALPSSSCFCCKAVILVKAQLANRTGPVLKYPSFG